MKINTDTWHYKLWRKSFTFREAVPEETDLCRYCHKVFWQMVGIGALIAMILALVGLCLVALFMLVYQGFWLHTLLTLKILGIAAAIIVPIVFYVRWLNSGRVRRTAPKTSLVGHWVAARKQSVCPLVEFSDEEESSQD